MGFRDRSDPNSARNTDPRNFDAKLSKKGCRQAQKLSENEEVRNFAPGLVVSSPHFRALQTALAVFNPTVTKKQVMVSSLLRETPRTTMPPNWVGQPQTQECRGKLKAVLRKDPCFKHRRLVDWTLLENGAWWSETILSTEDTRQEAAHFRTWLQKRRERKIAVIGHIGKLANMVEKKPSNIWPKNCQPYFCVLRQASRRLGPTLRYAGKTEAAAKKKQGQDDKIVLLVRHGKSQAQNYKEKRREKSSRMSARAVRRLKRTKTFLKRSRAPLPVVKKTSLKKTRAVCSVKKTFLKSKIAKLYRERRCSKVADSTVGKVPAAPRSAAKDVQSLTLLTASQLERISPGLSHDVQLGKALAEKSRIIDDIVEAEVSRKHARRGA